MSALWWISAFSHNAVAIVQKRRKTAEKRDRIEEKKGKGKPCEVQLHLKGVSKGEKERSCLREEIRGHLRVKQTQQRQLDKVERETEF